MRRCAISAHDMLARHPWAFALMESRTSPGPNALRYGDAVIGCLREAGFPIAMVAHAFSALDAHTYGLSMQEASLPLEDDVPEALLEQFPAVVYPNLAPMPVVRRFEAGRA